MAGPFQGECLSLPKWDRMLDEYYDLHGWERKSGRPTRKTLERAGLRDVANILGRAGKLPNPRPVKKHGYLSPLCGKEKK
jgi:aldehyde:ferredoxin oxidoreductase